MRLINTHTLKLELFTEPLAVSYAILSHTWEDDEVSFGDMQNLSIARTRRGFRKVRKTCAIARRNGIPYAWADTCCIDKSSSAELSEAINAMYRWYHNAFVCYTYLSGLLPGSRSSTYDELRDCRWFRRGWTLQELIAPDVMEIFDEEWNRIGTKEELAEVIAQITGIDEEVLNKTTPLSTIPLARRMSWAAERQTTRIEDRSYCLLGIFDVNMAMIYGEGPKAFMRLQEEILKTATDLSLFAWQSIYGRDRRTHRGVLAESPDEFLQCTDLQLSPDQFSFRGEISMTNKGIRIQTPLEYDGFGKYILDLHCYFPSIGFVGIHLERYLDIHLRSCTHKLTRIQHDTIANRMLTSSIYMASNLPQSSITKMIGEDNASQISINFLHDKNSYEIFDVKAVPETYWHAEQQHFSIHSLDRFWAFLRFRARVKDPFAIVASTHHTAAEPDGTGVIIVFKFEHSLLWFTIDTETGLRDRHLHNIIDPFSAIENYTAMGDPVSLKELSRDCTQDYQTSILCNDGDHVFIISVNLSKTPDRNSPFRMGVSLRPIQL